MECAIRVLVVWFLWVCFISDSHQLQTSQTQVLQQLRKHLEYPEPLEVWNNNRDLCYSPASSQLSIACDENSVVELKIMGDKSSKDSKFNGFSIPNQTLSDGFSVDSFVTTLARLSDLRVLSLVALGIWGPLPDKIHRLYSLEFLDLSSNFLYGSIPPKISAMAKLQIFTLDGNYFNDTVPDWFDSLTNLTSLSLKNNQLRGPIPPSLCRIKTLTDLALSQNDISGELPDLGGLTSLHLLDLRDNQIDSKLVEMPKTLVTVLLSNNSFSGEIPEQFGEFRMLQHLDLSSNSLSGMPPVNLFGLPNISYLNLASNTLTGSLPNRLSCSNALGFVDISNNRLTGVLPPCLSSMSNKRVKFGGNCLSIDQKTQHQASYCKETHTKKDSASKGISVGILVAVIAGIVIVLAFVAFGFLILCRKLCPRGTSDQHLLTKAVQDNSVTGFSSDVLRMQVRFYLEFISVCCLFHDSTLRMGGFISQAAKLVTTQGFPAYHLFSIEELKEATNNFDQSSFLGHGSIGKIYKGRMENGTYVAIRCLALFKRYSIRNLKLRLDLLSKIRHPNLVCLLGHCIDGGERDDSSVNRVFLVYEYVPNGNLHLHLSDSLEKVLKWSERLAVLISVAKAVHYLHTGMVPGFFNNQLKTNNILLDENRVAKLSDYGLTIITKEIDKQGAKEEGAKSLQLAKLGDDVYNFGLIIFEMLVGPSVTQKSEAYVLSEMVSFSSQDGRRRVVDPIVLNTCSQESLSTVISITNKCISPECVSRPSLEDVLWNLQYAAQIQANYDGDQRSDTA
ncbi:hypothetical protein Sjap_016455 [Stephania japonica]|uniref:Protein kinase domain-containing protein n=1 Tax=Stephania japonica TaxID=461633 RepID=A0AAP0IL35_9MAGN